MSHNLVIIPTYNECENAESIIRAVLALATPFHILIVDDNSQDGSASIVKNLQKEYEGRLHIEERAGKLGLGTAYIHGFKWAVQRNYDYIFEMDADFSHKPSDLLKLHKACAEEGADLAIGSRYSNGVTVVNWPIGRVIMSYYASVYVRTILGVPIHDTTAGFICYKKRVLQMINLDKIKFTGYAFQIEMKFTAFKHGFKIVEVPIIFMDRKLGKSKMSSGIFSEAFFGVIELKIKSWFRKYEQARDSF